MDAGGLVGMQVAHFESCSESPAVDTSGLVVMQVPRFESSSSVSALSRGSVLLDDAHCDAGCVASGSTYSSTNGGTWNNSATRPGVLRM